jgi:uncharacterized membrane protein YqjE
MSTESTEGRPPRTDGLMGSLRGLVYSVLRVVETRLEILSTEIAEERFNLARLVVVALGVLFCLQAGVLLGVLFFVLAVGGEHRLAAIGIAALVLLVAAAVGGLWLRSWLRRRPPMFAATMAELRKDGARLRGES